ncbi:MAG: thiamine phosphate synthase [Bryobacteraceae bacterium]
MPSLPDAFQLPRFYPIIDTGALSARNWSVFEFGEVLLQAGVGILQYRHKESWTQTHFNEAKALAGLAREAGAVFVVNDRVDFANLLDAAVHLGQMDLPPLAARKIGAEGIIGLSTHNRVQLEAGNEQPANYLALGPIYATKSKAQPDPVVGVDGLRNLRKLTGKPLVAIGGLTLDNASEVLEAGADSVATVAGILPDELGKLQSLAVEWLRRTS